MNRADNQAAMPTKPHPGAAIYAAEEAELSGGAKVEKHHQGYTGSGYVTGYYDSGTACTTFSVDVPASGSYYLSLRYAAGAAGNWNADRTVGLAINGAPVLPVPFKSTDAHWDTWSENVQRAELNAGINTVSYRCLTEHDNSDCIHLDRLSVWAHIANPTIDGLAFESEAYRVSEQHTVGVEVVEVDSNGASRSASSSAVYRSSDERIAQVDERTGAITGRAAGTAVITAECNGRRASAAVTVLANPVLTVECASRMRPVDPSMFGYILTPNYDVPDSRLTLLGPLLNRETIPAQNFQAISDLDGSYYAVEHSVLPRHLEAYRRVTSLGYRWYMMLGMNPSWATASGGPMDTMKPISMKTPEQRARFKQYMKDALQYLKDNGARPDFVNLTNEYWTGLEEVFKGNWEAVREVYPDFIPVTGPSGVGFGGIPDFYLPYASAEHITIEGPAWHEFWVNDRYAGLAQLQNWTGKIAELQASYPEANGKGIIWEENNAGSKDAADWTRSMANAIRTGVTQNIKGCLEAHNANGMSDLLTTNSPGPNPAARRPIWWVYFLFGQMSGHYAEVCTQGTEEFTAAACVDEAESKIVFVKDDCDGEVRLRLLRHPYPGEAVKIDLYKLAASENQGVAYQYSLTPSPSLDLDITVADVRANETWLLVVKREPSAPGFFYPILPDDGEAVTLPVTLTWSPSQGADGYSVTLSAQPDLSAPIVQAGGIADTRYTVGEGLLPGKTYYWSVSAENEHGCVPAAYRTIYSFLAASDSRIPGSFGPYLPTIGAWNEPVQPEFKWSTAYEADSYRIVISKHPDLSEPVIEQADIRTWRDTGMYGLESQGYYRPDTPLEFDTVYYWKVYAANSHGERPMNGPLRFFTTRAEGEEPKAFGLVAPAAGETGVSARTVLAWERSKNAFFYCLEIADNEEMANPLLVRDRMIHHRYTVEPNRLLPATTYYWRVTAYSRDLTFATAAAGGIRSITTEPVPCPPLLYAEREENGTAVLYFHPSVGATAYKVLYGTQSGRYTGTVEGVTESPCTVAGLSPGRYCFAIAAVNEAGDSSIWNERWVTIGQAAASTGSKRSSLTREISL
ncbi:CBM35 domain-containing protein [Gorillibacterium sp. sgz500922]|uniref:CBM35 domain-containing protein n=1 Tax=Gorillibacterium sp. sgz500922 TaxID=3446694 RepID=UPI003F6618D2